MTVPEKVHKVGDQVVIVGHEVGAHWMHDTPAVVVSDVASPFCGSCHCCPPDPDHAGDGSMCCGGPHYVVEYGCDEGDHRHHEVYAEHELEAGR